MDTQPVHLLRHAMRAYQLRTEALTSNLANMDTPGYRRLHVSFEEALQDARNGLGGTEPHRVEASMHVGDGPPILEDEMMDLADTQMRTQLGARALREHFTMLRTGITGRTG
ncbi:MAG: flagellar basal body protein [Bacteroidota bacterium]